MQVTNHCRGLGMRLRKMCELGQFSLFESENIGAVLILGKSWPSLLQHEKKECKLNCCMSGFGDLNIPLVNYTIKTA